MKEQSREEVGTGVPLSLSLSPHHPQLLLLLSPRFALQLQLKQHAQALLSFSVFLSLSVSGCRWQNWNQLTFGNKLMRALSSSLLLLLLLLLLFAHLLQDDVTTLAPVDCCSCSSLSSSSRL